MIAQETVTMRIYEYANDTDGRAGQPTMDLVKKTYTTTLKGEPITLETSRLAGKANAAVIGKYGDTVVLATVVMSKENKGVNFLPLTVDYEERFYAAGKIIGSRFVRREGRPSDEAMLSARLIDRTLRPLFDPRLRREVQVVITILAYDEEHDPDVIALLAASTALAISDIPWNGPVAGIKFVSPKTESSFGYQTFFSGTKDFVNMIEFEGKEFAERDAERIFTEAHEEIKKLIEFQTGIIKEIGKSKADVALAEPNPSLRHTVTEFLKDEIETALAEKRVEELQAKLFEHLKAQGEEEESLKIAEVVFEEEVDRFVHELAIKKGKRVDGRNLNEVRDLYAETGLFRRTHGSALFVRGETQVLSVTTLGTPAAEQLVETMETTGTKRFMLHYNFPSFSVGETGRSRGPGRREIGHGTLAFKAINAVLPSEEQFPYTIRIVAETLSSNGSSSMATTCASSLSLMDAGVPIEKPVAGIAIGLMSDEKGNYKILTDIQGPEDHYGDMDFKVAGTKDGVNAIQMDVKIGGITLQIFREALAAAREARLHILETMNAILPEPRKELSPFAPMITTLHIPPGKIGELIGPGGKTINGILAQAGNKVTIDVEQDGRVFVAGTDAALVAKVVGLIEQIFHEYRVGEVVEGPVVRILEFGAIVDLGGGRDGMIHVSELKNGFVKKVEDVVHVGDRVRAKIIRVEEGKIGLSVRQLEEGEKAR